jgi:hypothetical protein
MNGDDDEGDGDDHDDDESLGLSEDGDEDLGLDDDEDAEELDLDELDDDFDDAGDEPGTWELGNG